MSKVCPVCAKSYDDKNVFCPDDGSPLRVARVADEDDLVGTVIADRYLVTSKLGEGGMGRVYRARHVRLPQEVAIKVLHPSMVHDNASIARFNQEAANACRINNRHVVAVYDYGETRDELVYLAMEYVPGVSLTDLLEAGPLGPRRVANLTSQLADGLDAAHKLGILHRDLKPDNVMIAGDEDSELAKLVDFGIAKAVSEGQKGVTQTGFVVGTAEYMSPEQITGELLDRRSDLYSLGLVVFQMLTGVLPFVGDTKEAAMVARLTTTPRTLAQARPDVAWPTGLQAVFDRVLARSREERYPTAGDFAQSLARTVGEWLDTPAITTLRPDPPTRPETLVRPETPVRADTAVRPDLPPATPVRPVRSLALLTGSVVLVLVVAGGIWVATRWEKPQVIADTGESKLKHHGPGKPIVETPAAPPPPVYSRELVQRSLALIESKYLNANATEKTATDALKMLDALTPHLGEEHDSLTADVLRVEALLRLSKTDSACALARSIRPRTDSAQREELDLFSPLLRCRQ